MANLETIMANRTFDVEGAVSAVVDVVASTGTIAAKRGHLVVSVSGKWTAYPVATSPLTADYEAVGVLLEDANLSTTAVKARVLYAGQVWEQFIRDAGITATTVKMDALRVANGHIVFKDEE